MIDQQKWPHHCSLCKTGKCPDPGPWVSEADHQVWCCGEFLSKTFEEPVSVRNFLWLWDDNSLGSGGWLAQESKERHFSSRESWQQVSSSEFAGALFSGSFVYSMEGKPDAGHSAGKLEEHGVVQLYGWEMAEQAKLTSDGCQWQACSRPDSLEGHPAGTVFIGLASAAGTETIGSIYCWT